MEFLNTLTLKSKLQAINMMTVAAALSLASVVLLGYEVVNLRQSVERNVGVLAVMIGENSTAAMVFSDQRSAQELLQSLHSQPSILAAAIYAADGAVMASYSRSGEPAGLP